MMLNGAKSQNSQSTQRFTQKSLTKLENAYKKFSKELLDINIEDMELLKQYHSDQMLNVETRPKDITFDFDNYLHLYDGINKAIDHTLRVMEHMITLVAPVAKLPKGNRPKNELLRFGVTGIYFIYCEATGNKPKEGGILQNFILKSLTPFYTRVISHASLSEAVRDIIQDIKNIFLVMLTKK